MKTVFSTYILKLVNVSLTFSQQYLFKVSGVDELARGRVVDVRQVDGRGVGVNVLKDKRHRRRVGRRSAGRVQVVPGGGARPWQVVRVEGDRRGQ